MKLLKTIFYFGLLTSQAHLPTYIPNAAIAHTYFHQLTPNENFIADAMDIFHVIKPTAKTKFIELIISDIKTKYAILHSISYNQKIVYSESDSNNELERYTNIIYEYHFLHTTSAIERPHSPDPFIETYNQRNFVQNLSSSINLEDNLALAKSLNSSRSSY